MVKNDQKIVLTGDRPTGKLHLGHLVGSLLNRIKLQDQYKTYVMVADVQALTDNADNPEKVRNNLLEVVLDNMAVGVDPKKATFFVQSAVPQIAELTVFFLNLVTVARLERNPTVKEEMKQKGFDSSVPAGFLMYPVSQAADILFMKANIIPVGEDQLPMLEQTNEIVEKFNRYYGEVFQKVDKLVSETPRLKGLDGNSKMGKSLGNAIYLSDEEDVLKQKVMSMFTDPGHVKAEDPGKIEGNMVFEYLNVFDDDKGGLEDIKAHYQKGGLGDVAIKNRLFEILNAKLAPIRERRKELEKDKDQILKILEDGTKEVVQIGAKTLQEVKKAMKINYFD